MEARALERWEVPSRTGMLTPTDPASGAEELRGHPARPRPGQRRRPPQGPPAAAGARRAHRAAAARPRLHLRGRPDQPALRAPRGAATSAARSSRRSPVDLPNVNLTFLRHAKILPARDRRTARSTVAMADPSDLDSHAGSRGRDRAARRSRSLGTREGDRRRARGLRRAPRRPAVGRRRRQRSSTSARTRRTSTTSATSRARRRSSAS